MIRDQKFLAAFALVWSLFSMGYMVAATFAVIPESGKANSNLILGFLIGTAVAGILSWAFDGSYNQTKKDSVGIDPPLVPPVVTVTKTVDAPPSPPVTTTTSTETKA